MTRYDEACHDQNLREDAQACFFHFLCNAFSGVISPALAIAAAKIREDKLQVRFTNARLRRLSGPPNGPSEEKEASIIDLSFANKFPLHTHIQR